MTRDKYLVCGVAIAGGAGVAVWAGLPPATLVFLLVCPLMMFFMMRGMQSTSGRNDHHEAAKRDTDTAQQAAAGQSGQPDGSPERIDNS